LSDKRTDEEMTAHILYSDHLFDAYLLSDAEEDGENQVT